MVHWEGLEDASGEAQAVWLSKSRKVLPPGTSRTAPAPATQTARAAPPTSTEDQDSPLEEDNSLYESEWKPLRKCDCRTLNQRPPHTAQVLIEGGRATADAERMTVRYNFYNSPPRKLCQSTWFVVPHAKQADTMPPRPIPMRDCRVVEALYQRTLKAFSPLDGGPEQQKEVLQEEVPLYMDQGTYYAFVSYNPATKYISLRRRQTTSRLAAVLSFGTDNSQLLRRGYGAYHVPGEEEELHLGPVRHLMFVVHGVGEAMWSRPDTTMPSMIEEVDRVRALFHKKQTEKYKRECQRLQAQHQAQQSQSQSQSQSQNKTKNPESKVKLPPPPNRIEVLPIVWFDRIHNTSTQNPVKRSLESVTLHTIPALREIANDVVFDVLMYMTPEFCQVVLEEVTFQIMDLYDKFQKVHVDFLELGGRCSLVGHSLGSVICWDLLAVRKRIVEEEEEEEERRGVDWESMLYPLCELTSKKVKGTEKKKDGKEDGSSSSSDSEGEEQEVVGTGQEKQEQNEKDQEDTDKGQNNQAQKDHPQKDHTKPTITTTPAKTPPAPPNTTTTTLCQQAATYGPNLHQPMTKTIPFIPSFTAFIGSPLGLFLTLRGAHAYFEHLRIETLQDLQSQCQQEQNEEDKKKKERAYVSSSLHLCSPFALPSGAIYNIFHPSDPVAYRMEPLFMSPTLPKLNLPPPVLLTTEEGGIRAHIKVKQFGENVSKAWQEKRSSFVDMFAGAAGTMWAKNAAGGVGDRLTMGEGVELQDCSPVRSTAQTNSSTIATSRSGSPWSLGLSRRALQPQPQAQAQPQPLPPPEPPKLKFALGGKSERVDFSMQQGMIDNEYLSAVTAHGSYLSNGDVLDFLLETASESMREEEEEEEEENGGGVLVVK